MRGRCNIPLDEHQTEVIVDAHCNTYDKPEPPPVEAPSRSEVRP